MPGNMQCNICGTVICSTGDGEREAVRKHTIMFTKVNVIGICY